MSVRSFRPSLRILQRSKRRKRGLTLLEVSGALGIVAVVGVGFANMAAESQLATKDKATAVRLKEVTDAASAYVRANYPQIVQAAALNTPITIGVTANEPGTSGLQDLQTAGFLGSNFQNRNPYNQQHAVQVIKRAANTQGGPERLEVLVNTYGGNLISDRSLPRVATLVGAEGGYIPVAAAAYSAANTTQGTIIGSYGGWRAPVANYAAAGATAPSTGHVASTLGFDGNSILADFLYRFQVPGMPEANKMHASIDMTGNDINNLAIIRGQGGKLNIQDDLYVNHDVGMGNDLTVGRDASVGRNASVGQALTVSGSGLAGQTSVQVTQGDLNVANGSAVISKDGSIGRDMDIGRDIRAAGVVYSDMFASEQGVNYAVSPASTTTLSTLNPEFLNADTLVYGSVIGKGISTPNPNSVSVKNQVEAITDPVQRAAYLKNLAAAYDAEVRSKAGTTNSAVRLGELLPRYVARGLYVVSSNGEVQSYVNGSLQTVGGGGRVPYPTYKDPTSGGFVPGCGTGEAQIYLSKMDDSYSQDLNQYLGMTKGTLPLQASGTACDQYGCMGVDTAGATTQASVIDVRLGTLNVASNATVTSGGDAWYVGLSGTPSGLNGAGQQIARTVLAQTFCHFNFNDGAQYAGADAGLTR